MTPPTLAEQIGPRTPGAIYRTSDGVFEVLDLIVAPDLASALLLRRSARWAVIVRDLVRPGAQPFAVGSVWTSADQLIQAGPER
ncbi:MULTISPECIES: hypothetical protein [Streptomyces]|uniref:Uncharacterized protein n=1 Tax=Streptomyces evansiae TaxID=3075535 RepID=A0ABU2R7R3_9ACTN|nr:MULTISPECIES: hypothetical protein [unclassified Streptomyces]MDT0412736.1 hypothetical protein [Streptomyces sp. DSM 41979]MYQ56430.1 hypothetical protein [Streptomyces sp. SID4926]SCE48220.1 hypothetical protein GA0115252_152916 [Streptomyces sp. DfronAA-171]